MKFLYRLTEREKKYKFKDWFQVFWIAIRHPLIFMNYVGRRREGDKSLDQRKQEAEKLVKDISEGNYEVKSE
jgi:hypothetical protein